MYYLLYSFFYLLSLLPFRVLHLISDGIYLLLYYVIGYRRDVVMSNLKIAFPEKSEDELIKISKDFYQGMIDTFIETIKLLSISKKELSRRFTCENIEVLDDLYNKGKKIQGHVGHFFNFEFANAFFASHAKSPLLTVYMTISNKAVDRLFLKLRGRFGANMIPAGSFKRDFLPYAKDQYCLVLAADQNPGNRHKAYWLPFFNVMTPFPTGPEKGARMNNTAVVMLDFYKVKRGYYTSKLILLAEEASTLPEGEITKQFVRCLESSIRQRPSNYLWSHRRWRWKFTEEEYGHLVVK